MGAVASGKTSLLQKLKGEQLHYIKTQAIEFDGAAIDTPGEYMENRQYLYALTVTACDADLVVFTQDATSSETWYSPGQSSMFPSEVIGVITKIDAASKQQIRIARDALETAGAEKIFEVSSAAGTGIKELLDYLTQPGGRKRADRERKKGEK